MDTLRSIFARRGLLIQIVSDNGPQCTSKKFRKFTEKNGIRHVGEEPYHQATNSLAERMVQSFKHAVTTNMSSMTLQHRIDRFLSGYQAASHSTQLLFQQYLKARLALLRLRIKQVLDRNSWKMRTSILHVSTKTTRYGREIT